jgi:hypothetical protein
LAGARRDGKLPAPAGDLPTGPGPVIDVWRGRLRPGARPAGRREAPGRGPMTAGQLLRLYPCAWRDSGRDEFLAMVGPDALLGRQVVDVVAGAIDAWLSPEARSTTQGGAVHPAAKGDRTIVWWRKAASTDRWPTVTAREAPVGVFVLLVATITIPAFVC